MICNKSHSNSLRQSLKRAIRGWPRLSNLMAVRERTRSGQVLLIGFDSGGSTSIMTHDVSVQGIIRMLRYSNQAAAETRFF